MVTATINYYLDPSKGGITHYTPGTAGILRRKFDSQELNINDMRGHEGEFDIHKQSFQLCKWRPSSDHVEDEKIKEQIYREAEEFVKKTTGATRVDCFSHLVRRNTVEANKAELERLEAQKSKDNDPVKDTHGFGKVVPARFAHIDQSPIGARTLLDDNLEDEAPRLAKTRWGIINIWRPIKTITKDPLCLCDSRTIDDEDLAIVESTLPPKGGGGYYDSVSKGTGFQTLEVRANPAHKWWYVSQLQPDEALMFKIFDSKKSIKGRSGHTSFEDKAFTNDPPRESMEFRFFVFYENEPQE